MAQEEPKRTVTQFTEEELKALTEDLQEVLVKHNAEIGVTSTINLMKVTEEVAKTDDKKDSKEKEEEADSTPKKSG